MDGASGAIEDLKVRSSDGGSGQAGAAVFALDDPAPAVGVGGLDVGAVVSGPADLDGIRAAVAAHQVAYGVLEVAVMQLVEAGHRVAQGAGARLVLPGLLDPGVLPQDSARGGHRKSERDDPEVPGQPVQQSADNPQEPLLPALREILTHPARLDELISDVGVPQGCLVGNTTAELVPQDAEATEVVTRSYRRFTEIVTDALRRAQAAGEVTANSSPEAQAQLLLYIVQGLSLVSRAGLDQSAALAAIDTAVDGLRA